MEYGAPEANATWPLISQPSSVGVAVPTGAATEPARKSPPPKISSWASWGHHEPTISAWFIASPTHHAVDTQPRATSWITRT
ncbi:MAG: hypothetical protein ACXVH1_13080 [Solirubrobacteraceae bacterium]